MDSKGLQIMWSPRSSLYSPGGSSDLDTSASSNDSTISMGSRKRKDFTPRRSSKLDDPNFRGVTIWMANVFQDNDWKLRITSKFSLSPKRRKFTYVESSDEDEPSSGVYDGYGIEEKHCASCSAVKTPLWRDAEDGTPLCNACGIRYKKYKLRCVTCWHIPKKDEFSPKCCACGSFYQYVSPRR